MGNVKCGDPLHSTRTLEIGWADVMGSTSGADQYSYLCGACATARETSVAVNITKSDNYLTFTQADQVTCSDMLTYPDGTAVGEQSYTDSLANCLSAAEILTLHTLHGKVSASLRGKRDGDGKAAKPK